VLERLNQLDRRWIFLAMGLTVALPILTRFALPEPTSPLSQAFFDRVEELPPGSKVLISLDYDAATEGELGPMTTAFLRHCCLKGHKVCLLTLWPTGLPLCDQNIRTVIKGEFADLNWQYGVDYVNLGFVPGNEVAIKLLAQDLRKAFPTDVAGTRLDELPLLKDVRSARDFELVIDITAGTPGGKEWVQYAVTQGGLKLALGSVGVQVPQMAPYYPNQIVGLLAAIKGAAEYESALAQRYPERISLKRSAATQRMGPQLWAHLLMVGLILLGNAIHFATQRRGRR
jgi:hypothetical protein